MVRSYRLAGRSWIPAEIHSRPGPSSYTVDTEHSSFGDAMQINFALEPVIPNLVLKFQILCRVFRQFRFLMVYLPSISVWKSPVCQKKKLMCLPKTQKCQLQMNGDIRIQRTWFIPIILCGALKYPWNQLEPHGSFLFISVCITPQVSVELLKPLVIFF